MATADPSGMVWVPTWTTFFCCLLVLTPGTGAARRRAAVIRWLLWRVGAARLVLDAMWTSISNISLKEVCNVVLR